MKRELLWTLQRVYLCIFRSTDMRFSFAVSLLTMYVILTTARFINHQETPEEQSVSDEPLATDELELRHQCRSFGDECDAQLECCLGMYCLFDENHTLGRCDFIPAH